MAKQQRQLPAPTGTTEVSPGGIGPPPRSSRERTGAQAGPGRVGGVAGLPVAVLTNYMGSLTNPVGTRTNLTGFNAAALPGINTRFGFPAAPEGSPEVYRRIRSDPTIALARAFVMGAILSSRWSFVPKRPDVPQERIDFIRDVYDPIQASLKTQMLYSLDFGWRVFEQIYRVHPFNGREYIGVKKFKPLRPETTDILVTKRTGAYAGVKNGKTELDPDETLYFGYDVEDDDWYGTSRLENVREDAWWPWVCQMQAMGRLSTKNSSIMPVVKGPINTVEKGPNGEEISGFQAGMLVLRALLDGDGVLLENLAGSIDDLIGNPALAGVSKWDIKPYDTGASGQTTGSMLAYLQYLDQLKMRGYLVPERTATEGTKGTSAEAGQHADVGLSATEQLNQLMAQTVSWHSVNRLLVWNWGPEAEDSVFVQPTPLADDKKVIYRWLFQTLLTNPSVLDYVVKNLDLDAVAELLAVPVTEPLNDALEDREVEREESRELDMENKKNMAAGAGPAGPSGRPGRDVATVKKKGGRGSNNGSRPGKTNGA